jgi:EAL domain-containing protein (putative c-di-GMP-specific phosphodiesterase class I)
LALGFGANGSMSVVQRLHSRGIKLAFDDFGTGYASLSNLIRFPVSRIKIDRSFVSDIDQDAEKTAIVRALIAMARNLKLSVTAEGIETEAQAQFLIGENCEDGQGYLFCKPLPAQQFEDYLATMTLGATSDNRRAGCDHQMINGFPSAENPRTVRRS